MGNVSKGDAYEVTQVAADRYSKVLEAPISKKEILKTVQVNTFKTKGLGLFENPNREDFEKTLALKLPINMVFGRSTGA